MISAIIVAAGQGTRMGCKKQFMPICGAPLISYTLSVFQNSEVDEIILVTSCEDIEKMRLITSEYKITKLTTIVTGGLERSDSAINGINAANGDYVLIHDGARPFIKPNEIATAINEVKIHNAVCMAYPVKDTIKVVGQDGFISSTPERSTLFAAATPQCFQKDLIIKAYKKVKNDGFSITDDCMAAEYVNTKIKIIPCSYENIKITTAEDIPAAEAIIKRRKIQ